MPLRKINCISVDFRGFSRTIGEKRCLKNKARQERSILRKRD